MPSLLDDPEAYAFANLDEDRRRKLSAQDAMSALGGLLSQPVDYVKGRATSLLTDPIGDMKRTMQGTIDRAKQREQLQQVAYGDPQNPTRVTDQAAADQLAQDYLDMASTIMPAGILAPKRFQGGFLEGMPEAVDVGGRMEKFGTDMRLVDIAKDVTEKNGVVYSPQYKYAEIDLDRAKRLAKAYDKMANNPSDPKVKKAYDKMIEETMAQYEALRKKGYKFDFMPESGDIYGNPRNAINDLIINKRMSVFPTEQGFGGPSAAQALEANPLLMRIGEKWSGKEVTANDVFRAVHDAFGHAKHGVGFRARGEENAFQSHARMYSPEALPAVASETRGQNSWVNYGPYGAKNRTASPIDTEYAEQKTGIMPAWTWLEGLLR
jgi:hypothetical protein